MRQELRKCAEPGCAVVMTVDPSVFFCPIHTPGHCQRCRVELAAGFLCDECRCSAIAERSSVFDDLDHDSTAFETLRVREEEAEDGYREASRHLREHHPKPYWFKRTQ